MELRPRWRKVLADLFSNKARTILAVLSITVGVFAVGVVTATFSLLNRDLEKDYNSGNPSQATIYCDLFDDSLVKTIRRIPGIENAEGRTSMTLRLRTLEGDWMPIDLSALPKTIHREVGHIFPINGGALPKKLADDELVIEDAALAIAPLKTGDVVEIELPDKRIRRMRIAAIVHEPNSVPAAFSGSMTGYVNQDGMVRLGGSRLYSQLEIVVKDNKTSEDHVNAVAKLAASKVEKSGRRVYVTVVFRPGEHFAQQINRPLSVILTGFGILALLLGAFLVINTINAILSQHVRHIGIMKAVGASFTQVIGMYIVMIMAFGVLALVIALPLTALSARGFVQMLSSLLNFIPREFNMPINTVILEIVIGLSVPVLAALLPVLNGTRTTVREALSNYGLGKGQFGKGFIDRMLEKIRKIPRPTIISVRNTFRRKGRLMLTLSTLTLAGAIFIAVFNVRAAFFREIGDVLGYFMSDVNLSLNDTYRVSQVEQITRDIPEIVRLEPWGIAYANVLSDDKKTSFNILIVAPPSDSELIKPVLTTGRWLTPTDENAIVVSNHFLDQRPNTKLGDTIITKIGTKEYTWKIVGFIKMSGTFIPPFTYANGEYLARATANVGQSSLYRIVTQPNDPDTQQRAASKLAAALDVAGIKVSNIKTGAQENAEQAASINILIDVLLFMAVLIAIVGGLGLMGTMGINVIERTREIGVVRSVGATDQAVVRLVIVEGAVIGLLSCLIGLVLSVPISMLMDVVIGQSFVYTALPFTFDPMGVLIWLVVVTAISLVASIMPALNASRLTIREVLAYE